jgi:hypothetical protein
MQPENLSNEEYQEDIEQIIEDGNYHSDEASETDQERVQEEISLGIRPKNKSESDNHVIRVYDIPWHSTRVSKNFIVYYYCLLLIVFSLYIINIIG